MAARQQGSKAARQQGNKAEREGRKAASGAGRDGRRPFLPCCLAPLLPSLAALLPCSLAAFPCCLAALLPCCLPLLPCCLSALLPSCLPALLPSSLLPRKNEMRGRRWPATMGRDGHHHDHAGRSSRDFLNAAGILGKLGLGPAGGRRVQETADGVRAPARGEALTCGGGAPGGRGRVREGGLFRGRAVQFCRRVQQVTGPLT